jgi:WD40 repeat protein
MYEYNVHGGTPYMHKPRHYNGHWQSSFYVRSGFGPNDDTVISGSTSGSVYVWDASRRAKAHHRRRPTELVGHTQESTAVTWNKHNPSMMSSCSDDNTIRVWKMDRNQRLRSRDECTYDDDEWKRRRRVQQSCGGSDLLHGNDDSSCDNMEDVMHRPRDWGFVTGSGSSSGRGSGNGGTGAGVNGSSTRKRRNSSSVDGNNTKRLREGGIEEHNNASSWSCSSSQHGVQSSIFRYMTSTSSQEEELP